MFLDDYNNIPWFENRVIMGFNSLILLSRISLINSLTHQRQLLPQDIQLILISHCHPSVHPLDSLGTTLPPHLSVPFALHVIEVLLGPAGDDLGSTPDLHRLDVPYLLNPPLLDGGRVPPLYHLCSPLPLLLQSLAHTGAHAM